jgi:hypothetical protein
VTCRGRPGSGALTWPSTTDCLLRLMVGTHGSTSEHEVESEAEAVRAALDRIEAVLPNSPEEALNIIRDERAVWDKLDADVGRMLGEMDSR